MCIVCAFNYKFIIEYHRMVLILNEKKTISSSFPHEMITGYTSLDLNWFKKCCSWLLQTFKSNFERLSRLWNFLFSLWSNPLLITSMRIQWFPILMKILTVKSVTGRCQIISKLVLPTLRRSLWSPNINDYHTMEIKIWAEWWNR